MYLSRVYDNLEQYLKPNKVLVIYGSRQVGKTTLIKNYLQTTKFNYRLDSGDNIRIQQVLGSRDLKLLKEFTANHQLLVIDEAQRIPNIGIGLKLIVDHIPEIRVIATGSSSFELSGQIGEPLTGRKRTLVMYPLSQLELLKNFKNDRYTLNENLENSLIFGGYPDVITNPSRKEKIEVLEEITHSYLLKDILELEKVKNSKVLSDLLRLLAFQIGNEVSLHELGTQLGIDYKTVGRYLDLLEKSFVIYNLRGFSRNLRKEISKKSKYYFYDNGIRNTLISNYNNLQLRDDVGKLWENFLVIERLKTQEYKEIPSNNYFWRTWDHQEIDWIEEREGKLFGYEFKFSEKKVKTPKEFKQTYANAVIDVVNKENYLDFLV